jgi:hypothetical protein
VGLIVVVPVGTDTGALGREGEPPAAAEKKLLAAERAAVEKAVLAGHRRRPQVLLLGTFHFHDAGLDTYKPKFVFDPLSESGKKQVTEVLDRLEKFKPTKVVVEYPASKQDKLDEAFRRFTSGTAKPSKNETTQIGFALAGRLKHKQVYAFDADSHPSLPKPDVAAVARRLGQEGLTDKKALERYFDAIAIMDKWKSRLPLRQTLLAMNDPATIRLLHGVYLNGPFRVSDGKVYPGPDGFPTGWYNRNLRMLANLRRIATPEDRVLVVVGAGHLGILRHCAECCPEVELVEVEKYLAAR